MRLISQAFLAFLLALAVLVPADTALALPPGGSFVDDDGSVHEGYIEAIRAEGITYGCNPPLNDHYCPDRDVTRGEMAAFLDRAVGLSDDGGKDWFKDDNNSPFEDSINKLAAAGITTGCSSTNYCPNDPVTRGQMAAFLTRAYDLKGSTSGNPFIDDSGSVFEDDIEILAANGVTKGCNPPTNTKFCPTRPIRRDEMATFIGRASGLNPIVPSPRVDVGDVDVNIYPGDNINEVANSHADGTVFMIHGEFHGQQVSPRDSQVFIGDDAVMDGDNWARSAFDSYADNVQIINIEIRDYETTNEWRGAINGMGRDWVVMNCEIHHNSIAGLWMEGGGDPQIVDNYIHHNGRSGLSVRYTDGGLIQGNEISYNNYQDEWNWGWEAGAGKMWETDGLVIRGNYSHHNHGPGFWADTNNINTVYENNVIEDNYANGIFHEVSYDAVIRNNVIRRNGFDHAQWLWGGGIVIASSPNVEIYGNTIEDNFNGISLTKQDRGWGDYGEHTLANIYAHDNTIIDSGLTGAAYDDGSSEIYSSNIRFENNSYSGDVGWYWMNHEVSWSAWNGYGHDD